MLELSNKELKAIVTNTLNVPMDKWVLSIDRVYTQKDVNPKEEPKRNVRDQKHCNRSEDHL
jgi:hypothetical protein